MTYVGGNIREYDLWTATPRRTSPRRLAEASSDVDSGERPLVLGAGTREGVPYAVGATITYVADDGRRLFRVSVGSPVRLLAAGIGPGAQRVVASLADGRVVVLSKTGSVVRTSDYEPETVTAVLLALPGAIVQTGTDVRVGATTVALPAGRDPPRLPPGTARVREGLAGAFASRRDLGGHAPADDLPSRPDGSRSSRPTRGAPRGRRARPSAGAAGRFPEPAYNGATATSHRVASRRVAVTTNVECREAPRRSSSGMPARVGVPSIRTVRSAPFHASSSELPPGSSLSSTTSMPARGDDPDCSGSPDCVRAEGRLQTPTAAASGPGSSSPSSRIVRPSGSATNHSSSPTSSGCLDRPEDVPLALTVEAVDPDLAPVRARVVRQRHPVRRRPDGEATARSPRPERAPRARRALRAPPRLVHDLVAAALDLTLELVDEQVGSGLVRGGSLAAVEVRALDVELGLDEMVVGDLRVSLTVEDDLDERLVVEAAPELCELRLDVAPDPVVHVPVPHRDLAVA